MNNLIDINELIKLVWNLKVKILSLSALFSILSIFYALSLVEVYTVKATLLPSDSETETSLSKTNMSKGFSLPSLAGISIGGNGASVETNIALERLGSWAFIDDFIRSNNLESSILAIKDWDESNDVIYYYDDIGYDSVKDNWDNPEFINSKQVRWQLYKDFKNNLNISFSKSSGLINIHYTHESPEIAYQIILKLISDINIEMKNRKLKILDENIRNLEEYTSSLQEAALVQRLYDILAEQMSLRVIASGDNEFAFLIVAEPMIPFERTSPRRAFVVIALSFVGFIFSIMFFLVTSFFKKRTF